MSQAALAQAGEGRGSPWRRRGEGSLTGGHSILRARKRGGEQPGGHSSPARSVSLGVGRGPVAGRGLEREPKPTPSLAGAAGERTRRHLSKRERRGVRGGSWEEGGPVRTLRTDGRWWCGTHHVATAVSLGRRQTRGSEQLHPWLWVQWALPGCPERRGRYRGEESELTSF